MTQEAGPGSGGASRPARAAASTPLGRVRRGLRPSALATLAAAGALPFLGFINTNQTSSFDAGAVLRYALAVIVLLVALVTLTLACTRRADPHAVVFGTAAFATLFFAYPTWDAAFRAAGIQLGGAPAVRFGVWLLVAAAITKLVGDLARRTAFRQWIMATLFIVCGVSIVGIALGSADQGSSRSVASEATRAPASPNDLVRSPNVYLFLLDAYARNDVIEEQTGLDNGPFHEALDQRGFVTTEYSLSSYTATVLSTMALFEGSYPASEPADFADGGKSLERFVQGDNSTVERFKQLGYRMVHSHAGPFAFARCSRDFADTCIEADSAEGNVHELEVVLWGLTPGPLLLPLQAPRTTPTYVVDEIERLAPSEPFFLFAHVMSPHHPYLYDDACGRRQQAVQKPSVGLDEERDLYAHEVSCLNDEMVAAVDRIVATDPDAVILILSDHGSELLTDWDADLPDWTDEQVKERFAAQNNLRLPEACRHDVADDTPIVADFEIVFSCLEGREPVLPTYRGFYWRAHTQHVDELPDARWKPLTEPEATPTDDREG